VDVGPEDAESGGSDATATALAPAPRGIPGRWWHSTNRNPGVVAFVRRARKLLPGDPDFGDPLSTAGEGGPRAAARAADRLLSDRDAASREVSLSVLQVWQALTEGVSRRPANPEVTLVFTDLVGFSDWSLKAGDDATLTLLRQVAKAVETPLLDAGGHIVKRLGDGIMAVFRQPLVAVRAVLAADEAMKSVDVDGYTPTMRVGIHTGRPQRLASDWLGIDVNIAARVMERATKGGIMVSGVTLDLISQSDLDELGVVAKRARKPPFAHKPAGVPADLAIYRLKTRREFSPSVEPLETNAQA
jgi:class 3 adenylate cyclase